VEKKHQKQELCLSLAGKKGQGEIAGFSSKEGREGCGDCDGEKKAKRKQEKKKKSVLPVGTMKRGENWEKRKERGNGDGKKKREL